MAAPLTEEEENGIVQYWLERINPCLPAMVRAAFHQQLTCSSNSNIWQLQPEISTRIPALLMEREVVDLTD